ncbi:MAG TPA: hypothetical protein VLX91_01435 [Candidatus Acidoferrales bacterium]|nr:hypothetical protein [Candidatus Acidoferrales bacterium]
MKISFLFIISMWLIASGLSGGTENGRHTGGFSQPRNGTLQGTVELHNATQLIRREPGTPYGNQMPNMSDMPKHINENENVVIYLEGKELHTDENSEPRHETMNQKDATFIPHVLPILKGTFVDFVNEDDTYHNVFSLSPTKRFNIGRRPTGVVVPVRFDKTGVAEIFCDIHSYMSAFIIVLDNPFFTKPDAHGFFKIENIPPGTYTMKVWHERLHSESETVTITAGSTTTAHPVLE